MIAWKKNHPRFALKRDETKSAAASVPMTPPNGK